MEKLLEKTKNVFGEMHQNVFSCETHLGSAYANEGRYPEAEAMLRRSLYNQQTFFGKNKYTSLIAHTMLMLADILDKQNKCSDAEDILSMCLQAQKTLLGEENRDTLTTMKNLAGVYIRTGKHSLAVSMLKNCLEKAIYLLS